MADWVDHVIWWHVYPLGFVGAPAAPQEQVSHRLGRLEGWLDYLIELGASGLALGPVFASSSHGYDTVDHLRIDARLGDDEDFARVVSAAHGRGIKVLLDGVFNHVSTDHPTFQQALADGPDSPAARWFHLYWNSPGEAPDYEHFEGHRDLVTLNHAEPAVRDYVVEVMNHWLDLGADGWRLDAAYSMPAHFWGEVVARVRERHPEAYLVGEVIHGDYAEYVRESGLDSVTQYELWKSTWSSLNDRNFHELDWNLSRHNDWLDTFVPLTFLGNHDVTRIASQLHDERHYPHALAILLTVGGTPSIYAGDEQAFRGIKRDQPGGDDEVRPAFPDSPEDLAPFGEELFGMHQELIGLRRRHPWLHTARTQTLHLANDQIVYAASGSGAQIVVALNLADETVSLPAPGSGQVLAGTGAIDGWESVELGPHGWAVLGA